MNNSSSSFNRKRSFSRDHQGSNNPSPSRNWGSSSTMSRNYRGSTGHYDERRSQERVKTSTSFQNTLQSNQQAKNLPALTPGTLRILPLGGQGEKGRNCWILEVDSEIIILDAGVGFMPHGFKGGADVLLPNFTYLQENRDKIKALILSSAHEEQAGALPSFVEELGIKNIYLPQLASLIYGNKIQSEVSQTIIRVCTTVACINGNYISTQEKWLVNTQSTRWCHI